MRNGIGPSASFIISFVSAPIFTRYWAVVKMTYLGNASQQLISRLSFDPAMTAFRHREEGLLQGTGVD